MTNSVIETGKSPEEHYNEDEEVVVVENPVVEVEQEEEEEVFEEEEEEERALRDITIVDLTSVTEAIYAIRDEMIQLKRGVKRFKWLFPNISNIVKAFWLGKGSMLFGGLLVCSIGLNAYQGLKYLEAKEDSEKFRTGYYLWNYQKLMDKNNLAHFEKIEEEYANDVEIKHLVDTLLSEREIELALIKIRNENLLENQRIDKKLGENK